LDPCKTRQLPTKLIDYRIYLVWRIPDRLIHSSVDSTATGDTDCKYQHTSKRSIEYKHGKHYFTHKYDNGSNRSNARRYISRILFSEPILFIVKINRWVSNYTKESGKNELEALRLDRHVAIYNANVFISTLHLWSKCLWDLNSSRPSLLGLIGRKKMTGLRAVDNLCSKQIAF